MAERMTPVVAKVPPEEPIRPKRGIAAVRHFLTWGILAIAAVLCANLFVQVAAIWAGMFAFIAVEGLQAALADDATTALSVAGQLVALAVFLPWWQRCRRHGIGIMPGRAIPVGPALGCTKDAASSPAPWLDGEPTGGSSRTLPSTAGESPSDTPASDTPASGTPAEASPCALPAAPVPLRSRAARLLLICLAIVLTGIGLQTVISLLLGFILPLFPEVQRAYGEIMDSLGGTSALAVLSTVVLAPLSEELVLRGVVLQYALRAVTPAWNGRLSERECGLLAVSSARFWLANTLQALGFGILHLNITQGLYAFASGLVFGWLFGRTGRLRYGIALHLMVNLASFSVGGILAVFGALGLAGQLILPVACLVGGLALFARVAPGGGCLGKGRTA